MVESRPKDTDAPPIELRIRARFPHPKYSDDGLLANEAADKIEALQAEVERLRAVRYSKPESDDVLTLAEAVTALRFNQQTHADWASWFEDHADDPRQRADFGDADFHRATERKYENIIVTIEAAEASLSAALAANEALQGCLEEIDNYTGGADTVLDDEYVTERRVKALAALPQQPEGGRDAEG